MRGRMRPKKLVWRRSTKCDAGACVEVCNGFDEVMIRSSADPDSVAIAVTPEQWRSFLMRVKSGLFDRPAQGNFRN